MHSSKWSLEIHLNLNLTLSFYPLNRIIVKYLWFSFMVLSLWDFFWNVCGENCEILFSYYIIIRDNRELKHDFCFKRKWWLDFSAVVALVVYHWPVYIVSFCDHDRTCNTEVTLLSFSHSDGNCATKFGVSCYSLRVFFDVFVNLPHNLCDDKRRALRRFPAGWTTHWGPYGFIWRRNSRKNSIYLDLINVHSFFVILFTFFKRVKVKIAYILSVIY